MIKCFLILLGMLMTLALSGCGSKEIKKSAVLNQAESYSTSGISAFENANWKRANSFFQRALLIYQGNDDQSGQLLSYINLAEVGISTRDFNITQGYLDKALEITKNKGFEAYQDRVFLLFAINALRHNKVTQVETFLTDLLPKFNNNILTSTPSAIQITAIACRTKLAFIKQTEQVIWTARYANAINYSAKKNPPEQGRLLRFEAELLKNKGHYKEAEFLLHTALSNYKKSASRSGVAETLYDFGLLYLVQDQVPKATDYLERSLAVFTYLGDTLRMKQVAEMLDSSKFSSATIQ